MCVLAVPILRFTGVALTEIALLMLAGRPLW